MKNAPQHGVKELYFMFEEIYLIFTYKNFILTIFIMCLF